MLSRLEVYFQITLFGKHIQTEGFVSTYAASPVFCPLFHYPSIPEYFSSIQHQPEKQAMSGRKLPPSRKFHSIVAHPTSTICPMSS